MLIYKQGRFWAEGISFQIPDGFYLDTSPDLCYDVGITALDPTRSHSYVWAIFVSYQGTKETLEDLPQMGCRLLSKIASIQIGGLPGHWVIWTMGIGSGCYEARFDLGGNKHFTLMMDAHKCDIHEIIESAEFRSVWEGIRAEDIRHRCTST